MKKLDLMKLKKSILRIKREYLKLNYKNYKKASMKLNVEMNLLKEKLIC